MKTQVISIEPAVTNLSFNVIVSIGNDRHQFTLRVETNTVANQKIQGIRGDEHFLSVFRFNQNLGVEIYKLVSKAYEGQTLALPAEIGDFYTKEVELASK